MSNYVCKGAKLKCSMGSSQSDLNVIHLVNSVCLDNSPMANIMDYKPMMNIMSFGQCKSLANPTVAAATAANYGKLQEMPCIPNIVAPWLNGKMNMLIKGQPALMNNSKCMCIWAGVIEIADDGQGAAVGSQKVGTGATRVEEDNKVPKITKIYWVDKNGKNRALSELFENEECTLCLKVERGCVGKTINLTLEADEGKKFVGGETTRTYDNLVVKDDNTAYIGQFKVEYER